CKPRPWLDRALQSVPGTALRMFLTLGSVMLLWIFFRATTFGAAATMLERLVVPYAGKHCPIQDVSLGYTLFLVAICHALAHSGLWKRSAVRLPAPALGFGYALVLTLALLLAPDSGKAFIYFQF